MSWTGVLEELNVVVDTDKLSVVDPERLGVIRDEWGALERRRPETDTGLQPSAVEESDGFDRLHPWTIARDDELARAVCETTDLRRLAGVGDVFETRLRRHGFTSLVHIARTGSEELTAVSGIGSTRALNIHRSAIELLEADARSFEGRW